MRRREFISVFGGAVVLWPIAALAQKPPMPVIGFLHALSPENVPDLTHAFLQGLKEIGFVEGQNVRVEYRWARGHYDRLPKLAAELVRRQVAVIAATGGEPTPQVAEAATKTIPIVFTANGDPVKSGLVASLSRPGGNATGITIFGGAGVAKRLQLLHELVPQAIVVAYLVNSSNPNSDTETRAAQNAARFLGLELLVINATNKPELDAAFAAMVHQQASALVVASDSFFYLQRKKLSLLATKNRIPTIYYLSGFALVGGLIAYGNSLTDMFRLVGIYVGRILKGEKPDDLPVMQSSKFELVINLKAARALGLTVPPLLLARADKVIE
jgi:putative ABC transport system substrate-binding protein